MDYSRWMGPLLVVGLGLGCGGGTEVITASDSSSGRSSTSSGPPPSDTTSGTSSGGLDSTTSGLSSTGPAEESSSSTGNGLEDFGCPECIVVAEGLEGGRGLTLHEGYLYWTDQVEGTVERAPIGGAGPRELLVENQDAPYGVGVSGDFVYWTSFVEDGTVQRTSLEGGAVFGLAADAFPRFVQVVGDWVYWCSFDDVLGRVRRVSTKGVGNPPQTLVSVGSGVADFIVADDLVFFTAHLPPASPGLSPEGLVYSASATELTEEVNLQVLASEQAEPWGIAQYRKRLFWVNGIGDPPDEPRRVQSVPTVGGEPPQALSLQLTSPWGIAVDENYVYWTDHTLVSAIPHDGGDAIELADFQNVARTILVDDDWIYWITKERVLQRPKPEPR